MLGGVAGTISGTLSGGLVEPATPDAGSGVKTAVSCPAAAANDAPQTIVALWVEVATDLFVQPLIGLPPLLNVIVPDGRKPLVLDVTVAINRTPWLDTACVSDVVVGANAVRGTGALPDIKPSVAVIVNCPAVELVMLVVQVPSAPVVQPGALTPMGLDEKVMLSPDAAMPGGFVAVAVAVLVELPSATIVLGDNDALTFVATAAAGPASPNQPTPVASTTSPQAITPRVEVLSRRRRTIRPPTQ
jgi:hypothetical protein